MSGKKFLNDPTNAVSTCLDALTMCNADVERLATTNVIVRTEIPTDEVALVCGGGSGHEPAHAGFVADGLLTAAVCGDVFASPPHATITATLNHLDAKGVKKGILVIVKNYGGDLINFGYAVRAAKAKGIVCEMIVVGDDVTFGLHNDARRGIAGVVPFYKVLGAAAKQKATLAELVSMGKHVNLNMRSMGASLSSCSVPGSACTNPLKDDEMEVGLGIHGEKGESREKVAKASDVVDRLLEKIINGEKTADRWASGTHVALMVNNLGATTDLELGVLTHCALQQLREFFNLQVEVVSTGRFMTALEMHGFSITLIQIQPTPKGAEVKSYLLEGGKNSRIPFAEPLMAPRYHSVPAKAKLPSEEVANHPAGAKIREVLRVVLTTVQANADKYNELDAAVGDGDCGHGVARASTAVLAILDDLPFGSQLVESVMAVSEVVAESFAGTSGPLYGAFLVEAARALKDDAAQNGLAEFCAAFSQGSTAVTGLGDAKVGDRTMYDVLAAVSDKATELAAAATGGEAEAATAVATLVEVAEKRCGEVAQLTAKKGRARYLAGKEVGLPDPGCELVLDWLKAIAGTLAKN